MNALFAGIDVSLAENKAVFLDSTGEDVASRLRFPNNALGSELFLDKTLELCSQLNPERVLFGLEATSLYGWHLALLLNQAAQLAQFHPAVYLLNPRIVRGFKKSYPRVPKTDWADAWTIAQRLRFGQLPTPFRFDQRYFPLQRLTRLRVRLAKDITREKNYFLTYLFLKCSGLTTEKPLSDFFGAAASALVTEWYSVEDIAAASLESLAQFLIDKSSNKFANPVEVARQIQVAARHSYRLPTAVKGAVNHILASTLRHIRFLEGQLHEVSEAIAHEMKGLDNPLLTMPGLGPVFTAGILSEIGSITNFGNDDDLAAFTGLTWNRKQSGPFQGEDSHLSGTGNVYLRYYFVEGANRVRMHDPVFRDYYQRKFHEATIHQHKRALVLTARKLVRVVFALLRDNRPYSPPGKAGSYPQAA